MADANLKHKAVSGMIWSALQKYSVFFITFLSDIILARLLSPYDFGCIGILIVFTTLAETIIDGGFGSALIQKKSPTQEDYSTIFFWNLIMSVFLYCILYFSAPFIASFFDIPLLAPVLRVQGIILFIFSINMVQWTQLKKKLDFKTIAIITIICQVVSLVVAIYMAYYGYGVWSLVAKNLIAAFLASILFCIIIRWHPLWVFSWSSFKKLFSFGFFMFMSNIVTILSTRIQDILIGKVFSASSLGYYSKASTAQHMATTSISQIVEQVTYPLYAEVQDNYSALQTMVKKITMTLSYVSFPLIFLLLLFAKPFFVILYSEKWLVSVPYFQILCFAGLAQCLQSVNFYSILAIGKGKVSLEWTFIKRIVGIGFVVGGLVLFGMKGILWGAVINNWFAYFVNMCLVSKYVGYKWYNQLFDLLPILLVSALVALISYIIISPFNFNIYIDGLMKVVVYTLLFGIWSLGFKPAPYNYLITISKPFSHWLHNKFNT